MAGIAFVLLLIAVVVLHVVGGESAGSVADRLEGALGMALAAAIYETAKRAKGAVTATLVVLSLALLAGCGASAEEVRQTACTATRLACQACTIAEDRYCGGERVQTESDPKPCGDIDREYPGGEDTVIEPADRGET